KREEAQHALDASAALPELEARIGREPADLVGWSQGVLYANGLEVRHRPVFQDYAAQSPALEARNAAFFEGSSAPRFVIVRLVPIDERFPTASDSASLRAVLSYYRPVDAERGYCLFERDPEAA